MPDRILADLAVSPEGIETVRELLDDEADTVGMWYFDAMIEADKTRGDFEKSRPQTIETDSKKKSRKRRSNLGSFVLMQPLKDSHNPHESLLNKLRHGGFDFLVDSPETLEAIREMVKDTATPGDLRYLDLLKSIAEESIVPERPGPHAEPERPEGQGQHPTDVLAKEPVIDPSEPRSFSPEKSVGRTRFMYSLTERTRRIVRDIVRKAPDVLRVVPTGKLLLVLALTLLTGIVLGAFLF